MSYKPSDPYSREFTTASPTSGAATDADSLPTATADFDGGGTGSMSLTVTNLDTGRYKITGTIPAGRVGGDVLNVSVAATVGGVAGKAVVDTRVLDSRRVGDLDDPPDAAALWGATLPGAYPAGSAGALLGRVPDVELLAATILQGITELLTTGGGGGGGGVTGPVDLSAGAVAAVAGAILVTAANRLRSDAQGRVELAPGGLEQVPVGDAGGNARHALDAIYSAQAHDVQGAPASGPGHVTIGPPGDPRIEADVDGLGNRSNVTVTRRELP